MNGLENQKQQNDQQDQQQEEKVERDIDPVWRPEKTTFPALKRTSTASPTAVAKSPSIHRKIRISVLHSMILNGVQAIRQTGNVHGQITRFQISQRRPDRFHRICRCIEIAVEQVQRGIDIVFERIR